MPKGESLYSQYPKYEVVLEPNSARVQVTYQGEVVAESERTLIVRETRHDPVIYFPRSDVRFAALERTEHETFCPFKGEASYWSIRVGDRVEANAVWGYDDPFEEVAALVDYVSFYTNRAGLVQA